MYYAIHQPYGVYTMSGGDGLARFATKAERDSWVDAEEWDGSNYHRRAVGRDYARRRWPGAFRHGLDVIPSDRFEVPGFGMQEQPAWNRGEPHWSVHMDGTQWYAD